MLIKLLETLLSNAVTVTVLAVIVFALAKRIRQQRIVHGLWLVVLLKLITPALVVLPFAVTVDNTWLKLDHFSSLTSFVVGDPSVGTPSSDNAAGQLPNAEQVAASGNATLQLVDSHDTNSRNSADSELHSWSRFVVPLLIWVWLLGSCVYIVRLLIRYVQFCRFLRHNEQVDEALIGEGYDLAYKMGLKRPPRVRVLSGAFSPMLCGIGRGLTLILPLDLLHRLTPKGRATLIVHELAHYSRGDYLVRVLETIVTALYWWHPVVWWVRKELEIVEEDCCDARVVAEFPGEQRHYADAILDAIDILCERSAPLPPLASGLGTAPVLKRRLIRIMTETEVPATTRRGYVSVVACGILVLPFQMIHFRSEPGSVTGIAVETTLASGGVITAERDEYIDADLFVSQQQIDDVMNASCWCRVNSPNGDWTLLVDPHQRCRLASRSQQQLTELPVFSISCVVFSPDSQWLAVGTTDGSVLFFRAPDWKLIRKTNVGAAVKAIDVSSDCNRLAVCTDAGDVRILGVERLTCIVMRLLPSSSPNCLRFSPDDASLIVGCGDWKTESDSALMLLDSQSLKLSAGVNLTSPVALVRFGQSEDELITCNWSGQLVLWKLPDLLILNTQWIPKDLIAPMVFSVQADDSDLQFHQAY